jgi:L-ascorbate metabolism protein UlaG (beta-lactamase superfamily)
MQIKWHGHSCFEYSDGNITVVIDPHDGKSIGIKPPRATADIVLMTHDHYDHNAARVINGDHKNHLAHNGRFECKGMNFHGYATFHDQENGKLRGFNTMYAFQMDGISICHCGDLGDIPSDNVIKAVKGVNILFLPVGGVYTMENDQLKEFIELISPQVVVPMHYRVGGLTIPVASLDSFLSMIPEDNVVYVGNSLDISKDELPETKECWVFDRQ